MTKSGSLCPAVKAADIIGDKWVLLILREMFFGTSRYGEFQRALPRISPTVLSMRLKAMEANGLVIKKSVVGRKATEYHLTRSGRELAPLIEQMSKWGLRWARRRVIDEDVDVASFMWDFHRTVVTDELPDGETVLSISFVDEQPLGKWWLIINGDDVDLCSDDPGKDVDLYIAGALSDFVEIWMGDCALKTSVAEGGVTLTGSTYLARTAVHWFPRSRFAGVRPKQFMD